MKSVKYESTVCLYSPRDPGSPPENGNRTKNTMRFVSVIGHPNHYWMPPGDPHLDVHKSPPGFFVVPNAVRVRVIASHHVVEVVAMLGSDERDGKT